MAQVWLFVTSVEVTVTGPLQVSEMAAHWAMKLAGLVARGGTAEAHCSVAFVRQVIRGTMVSFTVIV